MKTGLSKLLKLVIMTLIVGTAILSVLQLETKAAAETTFCSRTGLPCDDDSDCSSINPTCFCAIVAGKGVCGEDFPVPPVDKKIVAR